MIKFIFFGRLVKEKGIGLILDVFPRLKKEGLNNWHLDIYGSGVFEETCIVFEKLLPDNVTFHGRKNQKEIISEINKKDFCLMPSLIIESFGLSALESIREGTPVIGFRKGGLEAFISDELNIEAQEGKSDADKLYSLLFSVLSSHKNKTNFPVAPASFELENYTPHAWVENFKQIAGDNKRILIVSDFIRKLGGVENYIHDAKELLASHGYIVEIYGMNKKNSFRGLFKTMFNFSAWRKFNKVISLFQPEIIWCNSVLRELGRLPLMAIPRTTKTLMMFHDMGYFNPRPSRMYKIHHVPESMGLLNRIKSGDKKNPIQILLLTLKRISLRSIRHVFRHRETTYLVPSNFMKPFVENLWQGKDQKTFVLPHFVK